jgi:hypothetical protein
MFHDFNPDFATCYFVQTPDLIRKVLSSLETQTKRNKYEKTKTSSKKMLLKETTDKRAAADGAARYCTAEFVASCTAGCPPKPLAYQAGGL